MLSIRHLDFQTDLPPSRLCSRVVLPPTTNATNISIQLKIVEFNVYYISSASRNL